MLGGGVGPRPRPLRPGPAHRNAAVTDSPDIYERSLARHAARHGKIEVASRMRLDSTDDLSLAYTPGVARPCEVIAKEPAAAWDLTWKGRTVAVVSDGSAILGLGDLGPLAALPVMEGKAALFREFAGVDAVPIVLDQHEPDDIVATVKAIAPSFGGINLEDISAPRCFEIEERLQDIGIPVLHDDQHGTAIVLLAALMNACRATGRSMGELRVVIAGAGAAGRAIARLLTCHETDDRCVPVAELLVCDSRGILNRDEPRGDATKDELAQQTNPHDRKGSLKDALDGADVFIGVSRGGLLGEEDIRRMRRGDTPGSGPIVLAMANPVPEVDPEAARRAGASVIGTGRSDLPNQVNNVLAFPGLFRGALEARATRFTNRMKWAAVDAIAASVPEPTAGVILPPAFDRSVASRVASAVAAACRESRACHEPPAGVQAANPA